MSFDDIINRVGTNSSKWDLMEGAFGVPANDGLAMWIADMDFRAPEFIQDATRDLLEKANYGYFCGVDALYEQVCWWMDTRHNWPIKPDWITLTYGLGNGIAMALQCLTDPGDSIVTFTPVYHEFEVKIGKNDRVNLQLPLVRLADGTYGIDFDLCDAKMTGNERMLILSSPHNPAGRVWTQDELSGIADFCIRHDLLLLSDEIHNDLTFGGHKHIPMHIAAPQIEDRLIMMTSGSKTFNIAGARLGCVIIPDATLNARYKSFHRSLDMSPNLLGVELTRAAYCPEGALWVDELTTYLEGNAKIFLDRMSSIAGVSAMPMQSTYLTWVDFAGTGLGRDAVHDRVYKQARVAPTPGHTLGKGGEDFLRFNIGTRRSLVEEACDRLTAAFADL